jgi:hypothetical protein
MAQSFVNALNRTEEIQKPSNIIHLDSIESASAILAEHDSTVNSNQIRKRKGVSSDDFVQNLINKYIYALHHSRKDWIEYGFFGRCDSTLSSFVPLFVKNINVSLVDVPDDSQDEGDDF